jgi:hypothetical protein
VIAVGQPARAVSRPWPVGRLNHGLPGSRVKARAPNQFTPLSKSELRDAWVTFLSPVPFQWFATLTFETNVHPEEAFKKWRRFTNDLNREIYGRHWTKRPNAGVHWVVAVERQKRGVVHLHAMLGDHRNLDLLARRLTWMDRWHAIAGYARIESIKSDEAAIRYVTKYVIKDGEIEFSPNLGRSVQPMLFGTTK